MASTPPAPPSFTELIVLPGDNVSSLLEPHAGASGLRLGSGLRQSEDGRVLATRAGVLSFLEPNRFFLLSSSCRYVPAAGDTVVGVVKDRLAESYRVRIHGTSLAQLPQLAFDGASRRNKPSLAVGSLVYARVAACSKHMEPELTCCAPPGSLAKDWVTGQSVFGELAGGRLVHVSTGLARRLLDPGCALLSALGKAMPFEAAVGLNGLVWVQAPEERHCAAVAAALEAAEFVSEAQGEQLAARFIAQFAAS
jgi:exosome complex component RRP40